MQEPDFAPLTRSQRTIVEAILFLIEKGDIPTVREVGAIVGLRSPATVYKHLRNLEKRKVITISGKSRGIRFTSKDVLRKALEGPPAKSRRRVKSRRPRRRSTGGAGGPGFSLPALSISPFKDRSRPGIPLVGAIAAGKPFESYSEAFVPDGMDQDGFYSDTTRKFNASTPFLPIDPALFGESGDLMALRVQGDSMIRAGILDGDYVIIRRQSTVEEGEIAAVIINGEGTLKRWRSRSKTPGKKTITLIPANERFDPIEISEEDGKDVLIFGKYVGLVRGNLQISS